MLAAKCPLVRYPTQLQKNGFKAQLLREECDNRMRDIFHKHYPSDSEQLYIKLTEQRGCLKKLKVITKEHLEVLYPADKKNPLQKIRYHIVVFVDP